MRIRVEDFVAETFGAYLGTSFCFRCPKRPEGFLRLKLREVRAASGSAGSSHCYSKPRSRPNLRAASVRWSIPTLSRRRC
jgi:hypothetical protein